MKKDTSNTINRAQRFPVILIGEGLLVGAVSGLVVMFYRIALTYAGEWLNEILIFIKGHPLRILAWFAVLILLALIVGRLVKWEPMISGSGIPQVEGEILGKLKEDWKRVLAASCASSAACPSVGKARQSSWAPWAARASPVFCTGERQKSGIS